MTGFIAKAKIFGTDNWKEGQIIGSNVIMCTCKKDPVIKQHNYWYIDAPAYYINPETVCWKCPETPYFEHDVLKVTDEFEEDNWVTIPNLIEMDYKIEVMGNLIDGHDLLKQENNE